MNPKPEPASFLRLRYFQHRGLVAVVFLLLGLAVFSVSLSNPFYYDDIDILANNAWLYGAGSLLPWFSDFLLDSNHLFTGYRPILMTSFWSSAMVCGPEAACYRVGNLLFHVLNAILLGMVFEQLIAHPRRRLLAWGAALLFLLHPLQTLGINFLFKRSSILVATFLLTSIWVHLRERKRNEGYRVGILGLQLCLFVLALGTKELGIVLPALLFVVDLCYRGKGVFEDRRSWVLYGILIAIGVGYFWFRTTYMEEQVSFHVSYLQDRRIIDSTTYFMRSLLIVPRYLWVWLVPQPLLVDDPLAFSDSLSFSFLFTPLTFIASLWLVWRFRSRPIVPFVVVLFWITLLPTTSIFPMFLLMDQIRLYLPLMGLSLLFPWLMVLVADRWDRAWVAPWLIGLLGVTYGVSTFQQNLRYRDPTVIWGDVVEAYPNSELGWTHLGWAWEEKEDFSKTSACYEQAYLLAPHQGQYLVRATLSRFYAGGDWEKNLEQIRAVPLEKLEPRGRLNLGVLEAEAGNFVRAEEILVQIATEFPYLGLAHLNLALVWEKAGKLEDARRAYHNASVLLPFRSEPKEGIKRLGAPRTASDGG